MSKWDHTHEAKLYRRARARAMRTLAWKYRLEYELLVQAHLNTIRKEDADELRGVPSGRESAEPSGTPDGDHD